MEKYAGHVSEQTLLENFADFIDDPLEEMEKMKEEQSAYGFNISDTEGDQEAIPGEPEED